jgi:tetratricopeptide (TPR) repeat protein
MLFLLVLASAPTAWAQQPEAVQQAQERHLDGVRLFQNGQLREAAEAFGQAEQLAPNPLNHYNRARCFQELGEPESALSSIDLYLAASSLSPTDRSDGEALRERILEAQRAAAPPEPLPLPLPVPEPEPEAPQPTEPVAEGPSLVGPWAMLGSGLALLVTGGVLDIVALSRSNPDGYDQLENLTDYEEWHTSTTNLALAGDVLVGLGAAAAVGGLVWLLVARGRRSSSQEATPPLSVAMGRDGLALQAHLRF